MLVRRFPYRAQLGLERQLRQMQRLLDELGDWPSDEDEDRDADERRHRGTASFAPPIDIYRNEGDLVIELELPGVDIENDVDVQVDDGMLIVSGERTSERERQRGESYVRERRTGRFSRRLSLPDGVDPDDISAEYDDGVLAIQVPIPESGDDGPRKIAVGHGYSSSRPKAVEPATTDDDAEAKDVQSDDDSTDANGSSSKKDSAKASKKNGGSSSTSKRSSKKAATKKSSRG